MDTIEYREKDIGSVINLWLKCDLVVLLNNPRKDIERKLGGDRDLFLVGILKGKIMEA